MIVRERTWTLRAGEQLTFWRSDGGTYTIDMKFSGDVDGPAISATTGSRDEALRALAGRFEMIATELRLLADALKP